MAHITTPEQLQAHLEASHDKLVLFHGTGGAFHEFAARSRNRSTHGELGEKNCDFGVHLTAMPHCAYEYAWQMQNASPQGGTVLVVEADIRKLYPISSRDLYLCLEPEQYAEWRAELIEAGYDGVVADDLGDDLHEACVVFDPRKLEIVGRLSIDLGEEFFLEQGGVIWNKPEVWPGIDMDHKQAPEEPDPAWSPGGALAM
jgi:hypothetical protein